MIRNAGDWIMTAIKDTRIVRIEVDKEHITMTIYLENGREIIVEAQEHESGSGSELAIDIRG